MLLESVAELFNHPLNDTEMQRAIADLSADPLWSVVSEREPGDVLTLQLAYIPTGAQLRIVQERSILGQWNSTI